MDMSQYIGASFVKFQDVAHGPRTEKIAAIRQGGYDRPVAQFESGDSLSLNSTNVKTLIRHYGKDGRDWIGMTIELYAGQTEYRNEKKDSVLVRPISPPKPFDERVRPEPKKLLAGDMNDEIPF